MMAAGLIGALAPDLDSISRLWEPLATITAHRSATHSFIGGAVIALATAGLVRAFTREKFLGLLGFAYAGLLTHIGLDLLTSFGTAVLWPLSARRFFLAQHYIFDPIISVLTVAFLLATFRLKEKRTLAATIGLVGILSYVLIAGIQQRTAFSRWQGYLESQGIKHTRSAVIPLFPGPFRWLGVSETKEAFYQQPFLLYGPPPKTLRMFSKTGVDLAHLEKLREVQLFLSFARFPWRQVWKEGSFWVIEYQELAFADHPLGGPLSLRIWVDESDSVKKVELGHRF